MKSIKYILLFIFCIYSALLQAQSTQATFGKNRIQYKKFNWMFVSSTNFDVYFSDGGYDNAVLAAKYAELEYQKIIELLDYSPYNRIKVIIYNSHDDLLQSNIQNPEENPALGGQINFVKSKIEVPFEGNQLEFKCKIAEQITKFLITDMMYGGSIRNTYRNNLFLNLPEWYIDGLAAYAARGWNHEMDDYMRDIFSNYKVNKPSSKSFANQTLIGQSVWHYIVESQGKKGIADVLTLTRISRNYETGISLNTGSKYSLFEKGWREYYRNNADATIDKYTLVDASKAVKRNSNFHDYYQVKNSPDGKFVAFSESSKGRYSVKVREVKTGRTYHFLSGGYKTVDQQINSKTPLLSWKSDRVLSVIETKKSKIQMTTREVTGGYKSKKIFGTFDQVIDFDYSDDGNTIVFSAEKEGKSDLFLFNVKQNTIRQISNDLYDETHPVFLKGSNAFVFASNRNFDTLSVPKVTLSSLKDNNNLFIYNPTISTTKFKQLTNTQYHESSPVSISATEIAYTQNETGVYNLTIMNIATGEKKLLTNYQQDILHFDISYNKNFSFSMLNKCREKLFINHTINFDQDLPTPNNTPRKQAHNFIDNIFNSPRIDTSDSKVIKSTENSISQPNQVVDTKKESHNNSLKSEIKNEEITFESTEVPSKKTVIAPEFSSPNNEINKQNNPTDTSDEININQYIFESETKKIDNSDDSQNQFAVGINTKIRTEESIKVSDFKSMRPILNLDNIISSIMFDPLRGFGMVGESAVSDMLENHRFNVYIFGKTDLATSSINFEYEYLKKRIDFKIKYDKQRLVNTYDNNLIIKTRTDKIEATFTYPISPLSRFSITPFGINSKSFNINPGTTTYPDRLNYFMGSRVEYVYDNTINTGMNMQYGTRLRITSDNYVGLKEKKSSFYRLEADIRNYKKVHKSIILATRLSAGTFWGSGAPNYLLGGLDNWLFASNPNSGEGTPLHFDSNTDTRSFLFNRYVTNLRGFTYSQQYGKNHILFNAELRIPIIKYLYNGQINSDFWRNLQIIGFYDIGSAWSGTNPFSSENSFNTTYKEEGTTFKAKVINFKNPFLASIGPGIHSHMFGYYAKCDLAWPIQDYVFKSPQLTISLGYDF